MEENQTPVPDSNLEQPAVVPPPISNPIANPKFKLLFLVAIILFLIFVAISSASFFLSKQKNESQTGKLTPTPTCMKRPACLDAKPRCLLPEPANGWCPD